MAMQNPDLSFGHGMACLKRTFSYMGRMQGCFWMGTMLSGLELLAAYLTPVLLSSLVTILQSGSLDGTGWKIAGMLFVFFLLLPFIALGDYWKKKGALEAEKNISTSLFEHVQKFSLKTLEQYEKGDYVIRITSDVSLGTGALRGYTFKALMKFVLYTTLSMAILLCHSLLYVIVGFFMSIVAFLISYHFSPKARQIERQARSMTATLASMLIETVSNAPVIRVFRMGKKLQERFAEGCRQIARKRVIYRAANGAIEGIVGLLGTSVRPVSFLMGIYLVTKGEMELSTVVYLSGVAGILAEGVQSFGQFIQFAQAGFASLDRIFELLDLEEDNPAVDIGYRHCPKEAGEGIALSIENLYFRYGEKEILKGINLEIPKGQKVAIMGKSGCGKSTLMKLIMGFYEPDQGEIALGFIPNDCSRVPDTAPACGITYVSQSCDLFRGSIRENIGFGKKDSGMEEIRTAAQRAGCAAFIESLPQGYDTVIEENGTNLSGGQKQKIALARGLLSDAPLFLLDEVTSAMDPVTQEQCLSEALKALQEKTVLAVTHKASVAERMDRILAMEDGMLSEVLL